MTESNELIAVIHQSVATSKELAKDLQDFIAESKDGYIHIPSVKAQVLASQLRITGNLVAALIEENSQIMDRVTELSERLKKK